jgi:hypothetical protein
VAQRTLPTPSLSFKPKDELDAQDQVRKGAFSQECKYEEGNGNTAERPYASTSITSAKSTRESAQEKTLPLPRKTKLFGCGEFVFSEMIGDAGTPPHPLRMLASYVTSFTSYAYLPR